MLFTRVVKRRLLTRDEKLVSGLVVLPTLCVISDDLEVDSRDRIKLNCLELLDNFALLPSLVEVLGRLREHHRRTLLKPLLAVLIDKDAELKTLEGHCLTNIDRLALSVKALRNNHNSGRRDVERNVRSLDGQQLSNCEIIGHRQRVLAWLL